MSSISTNARKCSTTNDTILGLILGDMNVYLSVRKIVENGDELIALAGELQTQFYRGHKLWNSLVRFAKLQSAAAPMYDYLLPAVQLFSKRAISAMSEMTPERLNVLTMASAMLELARAWTGLQAAISSSMPMTNALVDQSADLLEHLVDFLPGWIDGLPTTIQSLPALSAADDHYTQLITILHDVLVRMETLGPELVKLLRVYKAELPELRSFGRLVFDSVPDLSPALDATLGKAARTMPNLVLLYDDPIAFLPMLASSVLAGMRKGGLLAGIPALKKFMLNLARVADASKHFANTTQYETAFLIESLLPLAVAIPRYRGVMQTSSDLCVHGAVMIRQIRDSLIPALAKYPSYLEPLLKALRAPKLNLIALMPLMMHAMRAAAELLPRVMVSARYASPFLMSAVELNSQIGPFWAPLNRSIHEDSFDAFSYLNYLPLLVNDFSLLNTNSGGI